MDTNRRTAKRLLAAGILSIVAAPCYAQTRSEVIEAERVAKEAQLKPEAPAKAEQVFVRAQDSVAYRLFTGDLNGWGLGFGNITPGSGFAVGPQYTRTDLLGGRLTFNAAGRASMNNSYLGRLDLSLPSLLDGRAFVDFSTVHRNVSEMPYYGPGPDSQKTGRSNYRLEDTNVEIRPGFRPTKHLRTGLLGAYLAVNVGPGHSGKFISTDKQYSPAVTPGIDVQTNFLRGGGFVEYDWRQGITSPTGGGRYYAQYARYLDRGAGSASFYRLDLDASHYISFFNGTRVIALHGSTSLTDTGGNRAVPFYLQPTLGGSDTLRGYRIFRFYGDNSVMLNAEYRWQLSPILDMVAFADGGKVFNRWSQWNLHEMESDAGFGIRFKTRDKVAFSLDTGFSHEGFQIWFRVNNMF